MPVAISKDCSCLQIGGCRVSIASPLIVEGGIFPNPKNSGIPEVQFGKEQEYLFIIHTQIFESDLYDFLSMNF